MNGLLSCLSMRLLLIEDDVMLAQALMVGLRDAAYSVDWVSSGSAARLALAQEHYQALLLDLGLPECDGLTLLKELRHDSNAIPVVIITARDDLSTRVNGLDLGADDYLVKPFELDELLARMRAVIRRYAGQSSAVYHVGQLSLDPSNYQACFGNQVAILSAKEFALLQVLMLSPGKILSRSVLEERVYGWNEEVESNAIDFLIHGIRKKLGSDAIRNLRGAGWLVSKV